jgi:hypothetical protein
MHEYLRKCVLVDNAWQNTKVQYICLCLSLSLSLFFSHRPFVFIRCDFISL